VYVREEQQLLPRDLPFGLSRFDADGAIFEKGSARRRTSALSDLGFSRISGHQWGNAVARLGPRHRSIPQRRRASYRQRSLLNGTGLKADESATMVPSQRMGPSPFSVQLVTQRTFSDVCFLRDARSTLTKVGDVFFQHELPCRTPLLTMLLANTGPKRVRFQQRRFPPSWAPESNSSQRVLEFGERVVLAAPGRQPMGTESIQRQALRGS
jgi:hypothetical protein